LWETQQRLALKISISSATQVHWC